MMKKQSPESPCRIILSSGMKETIWTADCSLSKKSTMISPVLTKRNKQNNDDFRGKDDVRTRATEAKTWKTMKTKTTKKN